MKTKLSLILGVCGALAALFPSQAFAGGEIDPSFHPPSTDGEIFAVAVDSKTNIWIGGDFAHVGTNQNGIDTVPRYALAMLNPDGSLNVNFTLTSGTGTAPHPGFIADAYVVSVAVDSHDNVYAGFVINGGRSSGGFRAGVMRFLPQLDGVTGGYTSWVYDESYSTNVSYHMANVTSIAIGAATPLAYNNLPDYLFVSGSITESDAATATSFFPLALFDNFAGTMVTTFDGNFTDTYPLAAGTYGLPATPVIQQVHYVVGGAATIDGGQNFAHEHLVIAGNFGVARVDSAGNFYPSYYPLVNGSLLPPTDAQLLSCCGERNMADQLNCPNPHGELLAGGEVEPYVGIAGFRYGNALGFFLDRFDASDSTNYFPPINGYLNDPADNGTFLSKIIALPDGDMLVAGGFTSIRGVSVLNFAHLLADGSVDRSFPNYTGIGGPPNIGGYVLDMAAQPDGKYILAGIPEYLEFGEGPYYPQLERRLPLPASGITFNGPPQPASQTAYAGDSVTISASVTAWPGFVGQWEHGVVSLSGQDGSDLTLANVTTNDSGQYQLSAQLASFCAGSILSSAATLTVLPAPVPPLNDLFANAISLSGIAVTGLGTIRSATLDSGETDALGVYAGRSVWWTWTAPFSGPVGVDVSGSDFPAAIGLFTGNSVAGMTVVTNNYDYFGGGLLTDFSFNVSAGTTYQIAVGGQPNTGSLGDIVFTIAPIGSAWSSTTPLSSSSLNAVATANGQIVAVGESGTIVASSDGVNWTLPACPVTDDLSAVAYGDGQFVVTGDNGDILTSVDGTTWTQQSSGVSDFLAGVTFGKGLFVAVADDDVVLTSSDGVNWTPGTTGTDDSFKGITFGNNLFIIETLDSGLLYSSDGNVWSQAAINTSDYYYSVAYGNGQFVGVGYDGTVIASTDGVNWNQTTNGSSLAGIAFGDGRFVAVGQGGLVELSTDGTNWVADNSGTANQLSGVASYGAAQFVAAGQNGTILVSQLPHIAVFALRMDGTFQLSLTGLSGSIAIIDAATILNPPNWQPIATNVIVGGSVTFSDSSVSLSRFYRARLH